MPATRAALVAALIAAVSVLISCSRGVDRSGTPTPRPIPPGVHIAEAPAKGFERGDPTLEALDGASAEYGALGGTTYQIEVPDHWNHKLVLVLHGSHLGSSLYVETPFDPLRHYLIDNGFAWAASSYSTNELEPGTAADDTAAVWDRFVGEHGRPQWTYLIGESLGGGAALISAERYADRYDGALSLCGIEGQTAHTQNGGDMLALAAYVAGVTTAEWNAADNHSALFHQIERAFTVDDAEIQSIWVRLTGGPRPLDRAGFDQLIADGIPRFPTDYDNRETTYHLAGSGVPTSSDFNRDVLRLVVPASGENRVAQDPTGDLRIPVLAVNLTGDAVVPITEAQDIARLVASAGAGRLLVQRFVQGDRHCELTTGELDDEFEALVAWVEHGKKPKGEEILAANLQAIGSAYTELPRLDSEEARSLPTAGARLTLSGTLTVDGQPLDAPFLRAIVEKDGLLADCRYTFDERAIGTYARIIAPQSEQKGCGEPGATVYFEAFDRNQPSGLILASSNSFSWPESAGEESFDIKFSTSDRAGISKPFTTVTGEAFDPRGRRLIAGTTIDAFIGNTLCGQTSLPPFATLASNTFTLLIVGPESRPACLAGATVRLQVNGRDVSETVVNDLSEPGFTPGQFVELHEGGLPTRSVH